jgi:hypothetical protein
MLPLIPEIGCLAYNLVQLIYNKYNNVYSDIKTLIIRLFGSKKDAVNVIKINSIIPLARIFNAP